MPYHQIVLHRRQLPILRACDQSWDDLGGDARRRHCETCDHDVINLSALTERQARRVMARARSERVCVRYRVGDGGRVELAPDPRGGTLRALAVGAGLALLAGAATAHADASLPVAQADGAAAVTPRTDQPRPQPPPAPPPKKKKAKKKHDPDDDIRMGMLRSF